VVKQFVGRCEAISPGRLLQMSIHDELEVLSSRAKREGWTTEIQPNIANFQPDLVVSLPDGSNLIVEFKDQLTPLHMADLGQVVGFREAWNRERGPDHGRCQAMIVTHEEKPTEFFRAAANELGVDLLLTRKKGDDLAEEFVSRVRRTLQQL
jgi:hypothetical protein